MAEQVSKSTSFNTGGLILTEDEAMYKIFAKISLQFGSPQGVGTLYVTTK